VEENPRGNWLTQFQEKWLLNEAVIVVVLVVVRVE